jgi:hypothetical protein
LTSSFSLNDSLVSFLSELMFSSSIHSIIDLDSIFHDILRNSSYQASQSIWYTFSANNKSNLDQIETFGENYSLKRKNCGRFDITKFLARFLLMNNYNYEIQIKNTY